MRAQMGQHRNQASSSSARDDEAWLQLSLLLFIVAAIRAALRTDKQLAVLLATVLLPCCFAAVHQQGVIKLGEQRAESKCTLVYGQMNEPPGARARVALTGLTVAEYFRDMEGQDVLLFVDNIFRFTQVRLKWRLL